MLKWSKMASNSSLTVGSDALFVQLAREIAMDHFPLEDILTRYQITGEQWDAMQRNPRFGQLLSSAIQEWQSAGNTRERTQLKSAAIVESWLEEANTRLYDKSESLSAKTELIKFIARVAGMGVPNAELNGAGQEKFSVTINIGAGKQINIERDVTPRVIEGQTT